MSYAKLRGRIREIYGTNASFATDMQMNPATLSLKLNDQSPWKREEIERACEKLEIPIEEVFLYFFCKEVVKSQQTPIKKGAT